jgi:hypothetical protein
MPQRVARLVINIARSRKFNNGDTAPLDIETKENGLSSGVQAEAVIASDASGGRHPVVHSQVNPPALVPLIYFARPQTGRRPRQLYSALCGNRTIFRRPSQISMSFPSRSFLADAIAFKSLSQSSSLNPVKFPSDPT